MIKNVQLVLFLLIGSFVVLAKESKVKCISLGENVNKFSEVYMHSLESYVAVVSNGDIVYTDDAGENWYFSNLDTAFKSISTYASNIEFFDGLNGVVQHQNSVLYTSDGGKSWSLSTVAEGKQEDWIGVSVVSDSEAFLMDNNGNAFYSSDKGITWEYKSKATTFWSVSAFDFKSPTEGVCTSNFGHVYRTTNGGDSWLEIDDLGNSGLQNMTYVDGGAVYGYGFSSGLVRSTDDLKTTGGSLLNDVNHYHILDDQNIFVIGENDFYKSNNQGVTWDSVNLNNYNPWNIEGVHFFDANSGVFSSGTVIYKTVDAGLTWDTAFYSLPHSRSSYFNSENFGWLGGTQYYTTDGGDSWGELVLPNNSAYNLKDVSMLSEQEYFVLKDDLSYTSDGGQSFTQATSNPSIPFEIHFMNADTGFYTYNYGTLYTTHDAGASWGGYNTGSNPGTSEVKYFLFESGVFYVQINNIIYKSIDYGKNWEWFRPNYEESYTNVYVDSWGVYFRDPIHGYYTVGNLFYKTNDGGKTWEEFTVSTNPSNAFSSIVFFDEKNGLLGGEHGYIYETNDGGETWTYLDRISVDGIHNMIILNHGKVFVEGAKMAAILDLGKVDDCGVSLSIANCSADNYVVTASADVDDWVVNDNSTGNGGVDYQLVNPKNGDVIYAIQNGCKSNHISVDFPQAYVYSDSSFYCEGEIASAVIHFNRTEGVSYDYSFNGVTYNRVLSNNQSIDSLPVTISDTISFMISNINDGQCTNGYAYNSNEFIHTPYYFEHVAIDSTPRQGIVELVHEGDPYKVNVFPIAVGAKSEGTVIYATISAVYELSQGQVVRLMGSDDYDSQAEDVFGDYSNVVFSYIQDIHVDGETIYILMRNKKFLKAVNGTVVELADFSGNAQNIGDAQLKQVTYDEENGLFYFISDRQLFKYSESGSFEAVLGAGDYTYYSSHFSSALASEAILKDIEGVVVDNEGSVYLSDNDHNRIYKIEGDSILAFAGIGSTSIYGQKQFLDGEGLRVSVSSPVDLAVDENNNIYIATSSMMFVANPRGLVRRIASRDGQGSKKLFGCAEEVGIFSVSDLEVGADGDLYIINYPTGKTNDQIRPIAKLGNVASYLPDYSDTDVIGLFDGVESKILSFYPNPVSHEINIEFEKSNVVHVMVFDSKGLKVLNDDSRNDRISVIDLKTGVYHVVVELGDGTTVSNTFIKE